MARFCDKCGSPLRDVAEFCSNCGSHQPRPKGMETAPVAPKIPVPEIPAVDPVSDSFRSSGMQDGKVQKPRRPKKGFVKSLISWILFAAFLFGSVFYAFRFGSLLLSFYHPYNDAVGIYLGVSYSGDYDLSDFRQLAPNSYWEDRSPSDLLASAREEHAYEMDQDYYGEGMIYSYEILTRKKVSAEDLLYENLDRRCDEEPSEAYCIAVKIMLSGSRKEEEFIDAFYAVKIDGEWYVCSLDGSFVPEGNYNYYYW